MPDITPGETGWDTLEPFTLLSTLSFPLWTLLLHPALKKAPAIIPRKSQVYFKSQIMSASSVPAMLSNKSVTSVKDEGKIWTHLETWLHISASISSLLKMTLAPMCLLPALPSPGVISGCKAREGVPQTEVLMTSLSGRWISAVPSPRGESSPCLSRSFQVLPGSVCVQAVLTCSAESVSSTAEWATETLSVTEKQFSHFLRTREASSSPQLWCKTSAGELFSIYGGKLQH